MKKIRKKYFAVAMILIAVCICLTWKINDEKVNAQREIAENVIRLHVRANSNSIIDQKEKLAVRDYVIETLNQYKNQMTSVSAAKKIINEHIDELKTNSLKGLSVNDTVSIKMENSWFPEKTYGDITLPKGEYNAVVVNIGTGQGNNWWCVLFPQLCFLDNFSGYLEEESKEELSENLSPNTYGEIVDESIEAKFKIVQWLQKCLRFH